jgi:hypothetical protein
MRDSAREERFAKHNRTLDELWVRVENELLASRPHRERSPEEIYTLVTAECARRIVKLLGQDFKFAADLDFAAALAGLRLREPCSDPV